MNKSYDTKCQACLISYLDNYLDTYIVNIDKNLEH